MKRIIDVLKRELVIVGILDTRIENDIKWEDFTVRCFDERDCILYSNKILIASDTYEEIAARLNAMGLRENIDYLSFDKFVILYFWHEKGKLVIDNIQISCTTRCTLKCEQCMALIPYCKPSQDEILEEMKETVDLYFSLVDEVTSFRIIGGEPFLYRNLTDLISYIGDVYGNRIGCIECTTNGTIIPNESLIEAFSKYRCRINISDYTESVPYLNSNVNDLEILLKNNRIQVKRHVNYIWNDMRFADKDFIVDKEQVVLHRQKCDLSCRHIQNGKYYLCSVVYFAQKSSVICSQDRDYLDMKHASKEEMFYYNMGVIPKGAFAACYKCAGSDVVYRKEIVAGVQMKN